MPTLHYNLSTNLDITTHILCICICGGSSRLAVLIAFCTTQIIRAAHNRYVVDLYGSGTSDGHLQPSNPPPPTHRTTHN